MPATLEEDEVTDTVRSALQNRYGPKKRDDVVEGVEVEYVEKDGRQHVVECRAYTLKLETGRVYRDTIDGRDIEFRVDRVLGMGGEYQLTVAVGY